MADTRSAAAPTALPAWSGVIWSGVSTSRRSEVLHAATPVASRRAANVRAVLLVMDWLSVRLHARSRRRSELDVHAGNEVAQRRLRRELAVAAAGVRHRIVRLGVDARVLAPGVAEV